MRRGLLTFAFAVIAGGAVGVALPFAVAAVWPDDFTPGLNTEVP